jgi:hypothetical protein
MRVIVHEIETVLLRFRLGWCSSGRKERSDNVRKQNRKEGKGNQFELKRLQGDLVELFARQKRRSVEGR